MATWEGNRAGWRRALVVSLCLLLITILALVLSSCATTKALVDLPETWWVGTETVVSAIFEDLMWLLSHLVPGL